MQTIKNSVLSYLNSWIECTDCNEMVQASNMISNNEDELICIDCVEDQSLWNKI